MVKNLMPQSNFQLNVAQYTQNYAKMVTKKVAEGLQLEVSSIRDSSFDNATVSTDHPQTSTPYVKSFNRPSLPMENSLDISVIKNAEKPVAVDLKWPNAKILNIIEIMNGDLIESDIAEHFLKYVTDFELKKASVKRTVSTVQIFVEEDTIADKLLQACSDLIKIENKVGLSMLHYRNKNPFNKICELNMFSLREAIRLRYYAETETLDLSDFNLERDGFLPVHKDLKLPNVTVLSYLLTYACKICGDVKVLDLNNNNLEFLGEIEILKNHFKNITKIDLSYNKIADAGEIMRLRDWPIKFLNLSGNPLCILYPMNAFRKRIRRNFKELKRLDLQKGPSKKCESPIKLQERLEAIAADEKHQDVHLARKVLTFALASRFASEPAYASAYLKLNGWNFDKAESTGEIDSFSIAV